MFRRGPLSQQGIVDCLTEILTDNDDNTDEENEGDVPAAEIDPLDASVTLTLEEDATIIIIGDAIEQNQCREVPDIETAASDGRQEDKETCGEKKGKWRKKEEASINTDFTAPTRPAYNVSNALDVLFDKIFYETNLKSIQNNKPASISKDELKVFIGINMMMGYHCRFLVHTEGFRMYSNQRSNEQKQPF